MSAFSKNKSGGKRPEGGREQCRTVLTGRGCHFLAAKVPVEGKGWVRSPNSSSPPSKVGNLPLSPFARLVPVHFIIRMSQGNILFLRDFPPRAAGTASATGTVAAGQSSQLIITRSEKTQSSEGQGEKDSSPSTGTNRRRTLPTDFVFGTFSSGKLGTNQHRPAR